MWARNMELALALWLGVSPFVFGHGPDETALWANDFACAALIALLSLACYWRPMRRAHLAELAVAAWLVGFGWTQAFFHSATPASQNHVLVGLLVGMFAIVPSEASQPPTGWRKAADEPRA